jgi:hypothetical protein
MLKVRVGELAPFFVAKASNRPDYSFKSRGGRYTVLTFVAGSQYPRESELLAGLHSLPGLFDGIGSEMFIVTGDPEDDQFRRVPVREPGIRAFYDADRKIADLFGIPYQVGRPVSYLLSPRLQIIGIILAGGPQQQVNTIRDTLRRQVPIERIDDVFGSAPVLIVPHVFEPSLCRELIDTYIRDGGKPSGFMVAENGRTVGKYDPHYKVRRDVILSDPGLIAKVRDCFFQRVMPQMKRAYQFEARHLERFLVACYEAKDGGHFAVHRDDTTPGTAHRRFAATVNLNTEYEGGELCFPEFGEKKFRAPPGSAIIFSASLLNRALLVRRGTRYAFLPFIHDNAAERIRLANDGTIVGAEPPLRAKI